MLKSSHLYVLFLLKLTRPLVPLRLMRTFFVISPHPCVDASHGIFKWPKRCCYTHSSLVSEKAFNEPILFRRIGDQFLLELIVTTGSPKSSTLKGQPHCRSEALTLPSGRSVPKRARQATSIARLISFAHPCKANSYSIIIRLLELVNLFLLQRVLIGAAAADCFP